MKHKARRMSIDGDPLGYVEAHLVRDEDSGCVVYMGERNNKGYGVIHSRLKKILVHKFVWESENGLIAEGMELDHLCGNKPCCNTSHLEEVTHAENMRRHFARRKVCRNGHPISEATRCDNGCLVCVIVGRNRRKRLARAQS